MDLKDRINKIIEDEGVSVTEFADIIGVRESNIYKILRGDTKRMQLKTAKKINDIYSKYSTNWIVKGIDSNSDLPEIKLSDKDFKYLTEIAKFIESREDDLMQVPTFRLWVKTKKQQGAIEVLSKGD